MRPTPAQTRTAAMIGASAALLAGGILARIYARPRRRFMFAHIRDAGVANMEYAPDDWDRVDEASDASFPASDPPYHCIKSRFK